MSLRINNSNISQIKINGVNIQLAKINGSIVFEINGEIITLSFNDKSIIAISNKNGSYDFYYAKDGEILENYDKIVSFDLAANIESSYECLNSFNIAPYDANEIVVCKSGTSKVLSSSSLPSQFLFDSTTYGDKLYSVGLISDTHIDGDGTDTADSINDFEKALAFFSDESVNFIGHCGDVTENNRDSDYTAYSDIVADNTILIKTVAGNHDSYSTLESITGNSLYYEYIPEGSNDVYLFLGSYQYSLTNPFSDEELTWLETKLEEYKNKRVFLFFHYYCKPVGDANDYDDEELGTTGQAATFRSLMTTYKDNLIYFSGHSHLTYKLQEEISTANINSATDTLPKRVHIPSNGRPRILSDGSITNNYVGCECAIMDVYENCIVIRGKDLIANKFLPIANYLLDTTIINMGDEEENGNLYDYSTASTLDGYISRSAYTIKGSTTDKTTYLQIEPNSKYKVTKTASSRFVIGTFSDIPAIGGASGTKVIDDYTGTTLYITSGETDNYLAIQYYVTSDTLTEEEIRQSIEVIKMENTTENNLMPDFVAFSGTVAGVAYNFVEGTNKFTLSGTATSSSHIYSEQFAMNLIVGKTYAFRFNIVSGSIDASAHEDSYYDKNLIRVDDTGATAKMVSKDDVETPFHEQQFVVTQTYPYYKIDIKLKSNDIYTDVEIEVEVVQLD